MKKYISIILILIILLLTLTGCANNEKDDNSFKIVTSFYPMYVITQNITKGAENVIVENMAEVSTGCVHNYTLTTSDLRKIESADVFIQNGLGIESFMDKIVNTYSSLKIINASSNINNLILDEHELNAHVWTSISNYKIQVNEISQKLSEFNPENKEIYEKNAFNYLKKIEELEIMINKNKQTKVILFSESLAYLLKDFDIQYKQIHTHHEESALSAGDLSHIVEEMKQENIKVIIIDKNDSKKNAELIANETGANIYELDSCLTGNIDNNSYINAMKKNIEILNKI